MAVAPELFNHVRENDPDFASSQYFQRMAWLRHANDDLYDPSYHDMLRVAFTSEFNRGKLADLVSLLSGRNFESKTFEESIAENAFIQLKHGIEHFINETHFKRLVMIIKSAGFVSREMIRSQTTLNFAYILYLKLRTAGVPDAQIEGYVRRWFVLSVLTGRYSGSSESQIDADIRQIAVNDFPSLLSMTEEAVLSTAFWQVGLVQQLETSGTGNPYFWVFVAAQIKAGDKGLLSRDIAVRELVSHLGDIHHIFPRDYLKKHGLSRSQYNQIANYAYVQEEINIRIGNRSPAVYFKDVTAQCNGGPTKYGGIATIEDLRLNLAANCIPESVTDMDVMQYDIFLRQPRTLMAAKIREYYESL